MRTALLVLACAGCGSATPEPARIRAKVVRAEPGSYHVHKQYGGGGDDVLDTVDVSLILHDDRGAEVTLSEHFAAYGDLVRDDGKTVEMKGRWTRVEQRIDVHVVTERACVTSVFAPSCSAPDWAPTEWKLRCRAMQPIPPSELPAPALVCELADGAPVPRYTVVLDGVRVLVVGGPRDAISYRYD
jgi:hypothetical protein